MTDTLSALRRDRWQCFNAWRSQKTFYLVIILRKLNIAHIHNRGFLSNYYKLAIISQQYRLDGRACVFMCVCERVSEFFVKISWWIWSYIIMGLCSFYELIQTRATWFILVTIAIICHNHSGIDVEHANRCKMMRLWDLFYELWHHLSVPLSSLKSTKTLSDGDHLTVYNVTKYNKSLHACYILFGGYSTISPYNKKKSRAARHFLPDEKKSIQIMPTSRNSTYRHMYGQGFWVI